MRIFMLLILTVKVQFYPLKAPPLEQTFDQAVKQIALKLYF